MASTNPILSGGVLSTEIDWKTRISFAVRQKVVTKIVEWLIKNKLVEPQAAARAQERALKFEEKVFSSATSQDDYRRMIFIKMEHEKKALQQQSLVLSTPAAGSPPQIQSHKRPLEIQPGLHKQPSSVMHPLQCQRPVIHHQGTSELALQQQQNLNAINSRLNVQQKAVPDVLNPRTLYGSNTHSDKNMHQLGQQISSSTFNTQFRNFGMQNDQGNTVKISRNEHKLQQSQPTLLQTLGLQPRIQQSNMSQMRVQPLQNNIQVMAEGTSQTSHSVVDDWKEELFKKITKLKALFLLPLMVQQGKITKTLQKMECLSHHQRTVDYAKMQKLLLIHKKLIYFLNYSKDKMSEEILHSLPEVEKWAVYLVQDKRHGHVSSPQQKQLPSSDAQSPKKPVLLPCQTKRQIVTAQVEDNKGQMTKNLMQHHHNSQFNQALNINWIQGMEAEAGKIVHNKCVVNHSLSNTQPVKFQPVSTPYKSFTEVNMNNLEKSSQNTGQHSRSPFSVDPPSISSVQTQMKENQSIGTNTGDIHPQATSDAQSSDRPLASSISGISPSGLLAENVVNGQRQNSTTDLSESSVPEEPIQRLMKAARSMLPNAFSASVSDMQFALRMLDMTAGQIAGNDSEFAVGEDLFAPAPFTCGLKRDSSSQYDAFHLKSAIVSPCKRPRIEVNWNLLEEITEINLKLVETVVEISRDGIIFATAAPLTERDDGTVVRCSYTPAATSPHMKSDFASFLGAPIMPLKLLVPTSYPADSPVIMENLPSEISMNCDDLSAKAKSKLILGLRILRQPISLSDIARTWDTCARAVISEFSRTLGGGNFSSKYGTWVSYPSAA